MPEKKMTKIMITICEDMTEPKRIMEELGKKYP